MSRLMFVIQNFKRFLLIRYNNYDLKLGIIRHSNSKMHGRSREGKTLGDTHVYFLYAVPLQYVGDLGSPQLLLLQCMSIR